MKYLLSFLCYVVLCNAASAQRYETVLDRTGRKMLKGFVTDSVLKADTAAFSWFNQNQRSYDPPATIINSFTSQKDSVSFMVFFGTWCPDSHYVIPRFFKIAGQADVDKKRITMFALDRSKNDQAHFAANFNILHVPTIIILRNGRETGRVVEYGPSGKFDEELATTLSAPNR